MAWGQQAPSLFSLQIRDIVFFIVVVIVKMYNGWFLSCTGVTVS